jgi:two-component system CheB/CheR fusion protein
VTRPLRILLVDDDPDSLAVLSKLLARAGHEVRAARTAIAALGILADAPFDLLISDIALPGMDGCALMRVARVQYGILGIAITGFDGQADSERCRAAGFAHVLVKPIAFDAILAVIDRLAR